MILISMLALALWCASLGFVFGVVYAEAFRAKLARRIASRERLVISDDAEPTPIGTQFPVSGASSRVPWSQRRRDLEKQYAVPSVEED